LAGGLLQSGGVRIQLLAALFCLLLADAAPAQENRADGPSRPFVPSQPRGLIPEPGELERQAVFVDRQVGSADTKRGLFLTLPEDSTGISAGAGYRRWYSGDKLVVDGSAVVSTRLDKAGQARVEMGRIHPQAEGEDRRGPAPYASSFAGFLKWNPAAS